LSSLDAFVRNPAQSEGYLVTPYAWMMNAGDDDTSVKEGIWHISPELRGTLRRDQRHASDLVGYPLFVLLRAYLEITGERPISRPDAEKIALGIINDFKAAHPNEAMPKADFFAAVKRREKRIYPELAKRLWGQYAPESWKLPGHKRGRLRPM
jgi:hypothetical protein